MLLNIFKISIILSVTATALGESVYTGIINVLKERKAAKSNGDVDLHLFAVLFNGVVDTFVNNTVLTARMPNTGISVDYDGVLRQKIVKFLIEYPKRDICTPFDERLLKDIYNVLIEHSNRTTAPFIKLLDKSYYLSDKRVTWYEANQACVDMGASLISREENDERSLLYRFLKVNFDRNWWMSMDSKYLPHAPICMYLFYIEKKGRFFNVATNCNYSKYFICEK